MALSPRILNSLSEAKGSIKAKLVLSFSAQLGLSFLILISSILFLEFKRAKRDLLTVQERLREQIHFDGERLVTNESLALRPLVRSNSITAIQEVVANTVRNDSEIVYGVYMDHGEASASFFTSRDSSQCSDLCRPLGDSMSTWASGINKITFKSATVNGQEIIEFACPIFIKGVKHGTVRFAFSTRLMYAAIADADAVSRRSQKQTMCILLSVGLATFLIAAAFSKRQADKITRPIISLTNAARDLADRDYQAEIKVSEKDETGILAEVFEDMRAKIRNYMDNLETLVEEKVRQITDIMENIDQGLFTFDTGLKINPDHSQKAKEVLRVDALSERSLAEVLRLTPRQEDLFRDWVFVVQRDHKTQKWPRLSRLAPVHEIELGEGADKKQVKLEYRRILDRDGAIGRIMVLAQDVTEARRTVSRQKEEKILSEDRVKIILGVASYPQETIFEFLKDTVARVKVLQQRIGEIPCEADPAGIGRGADSDEDGFAWVAPVFRNCHTIKGNAGAFGFDALAAEAEKLENQLQSLKIEKYRMSFRPEAMIALLASMMDEIQKVNEIYLTVSGNVDETFIRLSQRKVAMILETADRLDNGRLPPEISAFLESCRRMSYRSLFSLAKKYRDLTARIGVKVGKNVIFETVPGDQEIDPSLLSRIDEALVHIIRNAVAHGIENNGEGMDAGKGPGRIELSYTRTPSSHVFKISDNGKGVDRSALLEKAVLMGMLTRDASEKLDAAERLDLIFRPGLSTNSTIDAISGRGLGLTIVSESVKAVGGDLSVESLPGIGTSVTISLPA